MWTEVTSRKGCGVCDPATRSVKKKSNRTEVREAGQSPRISRGLEPGTKVTGMYQGQRSGDQNHSPGVMSEQAPKEVEEWGVENRDHNPAGVEAIEDQAGQGCPKVYTEGL